MPGSDGWFGDEDGESDNARPDEDASELRLGEVARYLHALRRYGKQAANLAAGVAISHVVQAVVPLAGGAVAATLGVPAIWKTRAHIARLRELKAPRGVDCHCSHCDRIIDYAIDQKSRKVNRRVMGIFFSSIPVPGPGLVPVARGVVRHLFKSDPGVVRSNNAKLLWCSAKPSVPIQTTIEESERALLSFEHGERSCSKATLIIAELLGNYHRPKSREKAAALLWYAWGATVIKEKLAST